MPLDKWPAPDRDSVKTIEVSIDPHLTDMLAMDGDRGTNDEAVAKRVGHEVSRPRRWHKILERMGVLYPDDEGITHLTDLGRVLRDLPQTARTLQQDATESAISVLAKYQLRNPADNTGADTFETDVDIHPYWAVWKALSELDWKLHWDELNRELFHVLRHSELDAAIQRIKLARKDPDYNPIAGGSKKHKLSDRAYDQDGAPAGKSADDQVRDQKCTPWLRRAGFGELIIQGPGTEGKGYWTVPEAARPLLRRAVQTVPQYREFEDEEDWFRYYGSLENAAAAPIDVSPADAKKVADVFSAALTSAALSFGKNHELFVRSFLASAAAKRFVILSGLSGSGKTQIVQKLGQWFGPAHYEAVPVRPDWTSPEPILGYEDGLAQRADGTPVWNVPRILEFMVRCRRQPAKPHLLLLDEMNLAHVEQYFAEILSGLESGEAVIPDVTWDATSNRWILATRGRLPLPENLFIVGTVNVDETTYMFSPKVLDRAHTIEFQVTTDDLPTDTMTLVRPGDLQPGESTLLRMLLDLSRDREWQKRHAPDLGDQLAKDLRAVHAALTPVGFEFGYRLIFEAGRFAALLRAMSEPMPYEILLDRVVMQKVLPRLHGSRKRLEPALRTLGAIIFDGSTNPAFDPLAKTAKLPRCPESFGKLQRMMLRLKMDHFASFAG